MKSESWSILLTFVLHERNVIQGQDRADGFCLRTLKRAMQLDRKADRSVAICLELQQGKVTAASAVVIKQYHQNFPNTCVGLPWNSASLPSCRPLIQQQYHHRSLHSSLTISEYALRSISGEATRASGTKYGSFEKRTLLKWTPLTTLPSMMTRVSFAKSLKIISSG